MRMPSGRWIASTLITSAPRFASIWQAEGPAHQAVVSITRMPLSGRSGSLAPEGEIPEGAEAQTALIFKNISTVLEASGAGLENVVRLNAYVTERQHLPGYMRARDAALGELPPTASTLMIVSGFARPEFVVEVEAVAAIESAACESAGGASLFSLLSR